MHESATPRALAGLVSLLLAAACSPPPPLPDAGDDVATNDATPTPDAPPADAGERTEVRIRFRAMVGSMPFSCGQTYPGLGTTSSTWTPRDFRMYVHDVRLVTAAGPVAVELTQDRMWQHENVALLDFEDRSMSCSNGTTQTNDVVVGTVPRGAGPFTGVVFSLGVPFAMNHRDPAVQPSPMNLTAMWWNWNGGYKFTKIEGSTTGLPSGYNIHVGSTGCAGNETGANNPCMAPNVVTVTLTGAFDPATNAIVADLAALVRESNLDMNAGGAPGCMSGPDPDCAPLFRAFGLPFGMTPGNPAAQTFFRLE